MNIFHQLGIAEEIEDTGKNSIYSFFQKPLGSFSIISMIIIMKIDSANIVFERNGPHQVLLR